MLSSPYQSPVLCFCVLIFHLCFGLMCLFLSCFPFSCSNQTPLFYFHVVIFHLCHCLMSLCLPCILLSYPDLSTVLWYHVLMSILCSAFMSLSWQKIYEEKWSVSSYFLHHYEDSNEAGMIFLDKLSLKTLGAYIFIVFWLKMQFELCD